MNQRKNSFIRNILAVAAVVCLWHSPLAARGQIYLTSTNLALNSTFTNAVPNASTNTTSYIDVPVNNWGEVALTVAFKLATAGNSNVLFGFYRSPDGTTFESSPYASLQVTANGNTKVVAMTNFNVGSFGYLRMIGVNNPNTNSANYMTNFEFYSTIKPWTRGIGVSN